MSPQAASRVGVFFLVAIVCGATSARAATFTVNTTVDSADAVPGDGVCADANGNCSLRAAIMESSAEANPIADVIRLPAGVYRVDQGPLKVMSNARIEGAGSGLTTVESDGPTGVFELGLLTYASKLLDGTDTVT